jgi:hypothetical protein
MLPERPVQLIVNATPLLVPAAVVTVTSRDRRVAPELTRNVAVIVVAFTTTTLLTVIDPPCTATVAGALKFVPTSVTATVAPRPPAFGAIELNVGFATTGAFTVNTCAPLVPVLVDTVTLRVPTAADAAIVNVAVICVALTTATFVASTPVPLIPTVAPAWKLDPASVSETLVPCVPLFSAIELNPGAGAVIVTVAVPIAEGETVLAA